MGIDCIKISVVIAVYNSEKYIRQMLDSILFQTFREIEIICVDDMSTDGTVDILNEYAVRDERIKILFHKESTDGAAAARNMGIESAKGEYLSILDADDYFEPEMLEKVYSRAVSTEADVVLYNGWVFDERIGADREADFILRQEYLPKNKVLFSPDENSSGLFLMTCGAAWNGLYRRDFVINENLRFQEFHHADDLGFVYLAFASAKRISIIDDKYIHYRKNTGCSQSDFVYLWPEGCYGALAQLKEALEKKGIFEKYHESFVQMVLVYVVFYLDSMHDWYSFEKLYTDFKNKWFEYFGVYNVLDESFRVSLWAKIRNAIRKYSPADYLFRKVKGLEPFENVEAWKRIIPVETEIVIYGAGKIGTKIFCEQIITKEYRIKAWVDKNFRAIGYPVVSPERISQLSSEVILVAIASKTIFEHVKERLIGLGVGADRIYWIGEENG